MIDTCPLCFEKLMPMMIHKDFFMCDLCGCYAEDLNEGDVDELQDIIDKHNAAEQSVHLTVDTCPDCKILVF